MKSRKLKAILAALSAVAVMATAMTGFAATTTTYNAANNKIEVEATLTAEKGKEVTYLVKQGEDILYIDQATATDGTVTFNYKIDKSKYTARNTVISYGTDGSEAVGDTVSSLGIAALPTAAADANYTITYGDNITYAAPGEEVDATIAAKPGYEITKLVIDNAEKDGAGTYKVTIGSNIVVTTALQAVTPEITEVSDAVIGTHEEDGVTYGTYMRVMKIAGEPSEYGLEWNGYTFRAIDNTDGYAAVKLILPADVDAGKTEVKTYWIADDVPHYFE